MAVIHYKGKVYPIFHRVTFLLNHKETVFYCEIYDISDIPNGIRFEYCYQVYRQIVNNPLKIMRDFLLVRVPCKIEVLEDDYRIILDKDDYRIILDKKDNLTH